jgi:hypothetical protein
MSDNTGFSLIHPKSMDNVMLDIETMGTTCTAAIISIGAVFFDKDLGLGSTFYSQISLDSAIRSGMTVDGSTIMWWMEREEAARKAFFNNIKARALDDALLDFTAFIGMYGNAPHIWGNGSDFDNVIIHSACRLLGKNRPWEYYKNRDFRTLKSLYRDIPSPVKTGTEHNALDDAVWQAEYAILILKEHDRRKQGPVEYPIRTNY